MTRRGSRRVRNLWLGVGVTVIGSGLVAGGVWWLDRRQNTDLTDASENVTSRFRDSDIAAMTPIRFVQAAEASGIVMRHGPGLRGRTLPEDTGSGVAWGDYDGDGDPDLYFVNIPGPLAGEPATGGSNRLFRNDDGRFVDVTEAAGVADVDGFGMGATFADYDADGDLDLHVTNFGPNRLFRNRGDGTFEEVAEAAGVADALWGAGGTWGDFDRDGDLDLYVTNYVEYDLVGLDIDFTTETAMGSYDMPFTLNPNSFDPQPNRLFRNRGDGTFEEVAEELGVDDAAGRGLAATFCDVDGDGWLDLYVNNDVSTNRLFRNRLGDGLTTGSAFRDIASITGTADPRGSMGLSVAEIGWMTGDADGLPDLFITHWVAQENALYQSVMRFPGGLEYRDRTRIFRLGEISTDLVGWGSGFADFDLDGRIDIAVANGSTLEEVDAPLRLESEPVSILWNDGTVFHDVASASGEPLIRGYWGRGLAIADYDGDGDPDVAIAVNRGSPLLLRNETDTDNHSLAVRLAAPAAASFGARVEVVVEGRTQVRWPTCDVSYLANHSPEALFGLGSAPLADTVRVVWADGTITVATAVEAGVTALEHAAGRAPR